MTRPNLACSFVILVACSPRPTPQFEETVPPPAFSEPPIAEKPKDVPWHECPAMLVDEPLAYFGDRVSLRPPVGVTKENLVEYTPGVFVRSETTIESGNCNEGMSGPLIYFIALTVIDEQPTPARPIEQIRADTMAAFGYPRHITFVDQNYFPDGPTNVWIYEFTPDEYFRGVDFGDSPEPTKVLLALQVAHGRTYALVFTVHPNAWFVIGSSLVASAESLRVLPP